MRRMTKGHDVTYNDIWHRQPIRRAAPLATLAILLCSGASCRNAAAEPSAGGARSSVLDAALGDGDPSPEISTTEFQAALRDPSVIVFDARRQGNNRSGPFPARA